MKVEIFNETTLEYEDFDLNEEFKNLTIIEGNSLTRSLIISDEKKFNNIFIKYFKNGEQINGIKDNKIIINEFIAFSHNEFYIEDSTFKKSLNEKINSHNIEIKIEFLKDINKIETVSESIELLFEII